MDLVKRDLSYLEMAYKLAINSKDTSTQNGAVLIRRINDLDEIIGKGINCFPRGVKYSEERLSRPLKYFYTEHAERNAILDAARQGNSTEGSILYCPWFACADCGRAIIQAGIKEVIGWQGIEKMIKETSRGSDSMNWKKSIECALQMFDEAEVKYRWVEGNLSQKDLKILFSGKVFNLKNFY